MAVINQNHSHPTVLRRWLDPVALPQDKDEELTNRANTIQS